MPFPRLLGCTVPLFSLRSRQDFGVGDIDMLPKAGRWLARAGIRLVQVLPPHELAEGEASPYGARTAFGIDPLFIGLGAVPELAGDALASALGEEGERERRALSALDRVDYARSRALKEKALRAAYQTFLEREWARGSGRAAAFRSFLAAAPWEDDLSLYVALRASHENHGWRFWPEGERRRERDVLLAARERHDGAIRYHGYKQWLAHGQWVAAREMLAAAGILLMGDVPFVVGSESADVWAHADQFQTGASLGAPPDAFAPDGQDWGLPPYDWEAMDATDLAWARARMKRAAELYDCFRLDHVVGYFRQYVRTVGADGKKHGAATPSGATAQEALGRRVLTSMKAAAGGSRLIGEDLGVVPPFVRAALTDLDVPGYKVIPWEREYDAPGQPFKDPKKYPAASVATWSTHDTPPITGWWDDFEPKDRSAIAKVAGFSTDAGPRERWTGFMTTLLSSNSDLALVQAAELTLERARINTPGTVGPLNWTYRLPMPIEELEGDPAQGARMDELRGLADRAKRTGAPGR